MKLMNIESYFLIVLGGFAIVWSFRWVRYRGRIKEPLSEFEYAASSAVLGSFLLGASWVLAHYLKWPPNDVLAAFGQLPFAGTMVLALIGSTIGMAAGSIRKYFK
jgi:hypothetical protein